MEKIIGMKVVNERSAEDFNNKAEQLLKDGYQPDGPMTVWTKDATYFTQNFIKRTDKTVEDGCVKRTIHMVFSSDAEIAFFTHALAQRFLKVQGGSLIHQIISQLESK